MKLLVEPAGSRQRLACSVGAIVAIAFLLIASAGRAAADQVYWANGNTIAYSQLDDKAGGYLFDSVNALHDPEGTAIDTANGRIYVSLAGSDQIVWFGLEGGRGVVNTAPGSVDHPTNIAIDPASQTLYWANDVNPGSIGYARVDESGGGFLVKPGSTEATVAKPSRVAIDTLHHRLYWWNELTDEFSWATEDGLLSGNLVTPGLAIGEGEMGGIALEPYSTPLELYFMDNEAGGIFHTDPLLGGKPEEVQGAVTEKNSLEPIGLAFDETGHRFYWTNHVVDEEPATAIGSATLFGQPETIPVFPIAPIHAPTFAAILKAPVSLGPPLLTGAGATMTCTLGEWEGDHPGAAVYAAPTSYRYQWRKGSAPIAGATGASLTATESGSYACEVLAVNAAGETGKTSKAMTLTFPAPPKTTTPSTPKPKAESKPKAEPPAKSAAVGAKLASTKPAKVKAGGTAVISVDLTNSGTATSAAAKVCGTLAKKAKRGLATPKCVSVSSVAAGKTVVAKLAIKTKGSAKGIYKLTVVVSGATTASLPAKVQVAPVKKVKKKK